MRFKGLDLNLVVALDALLEARSVSRAAERLHLSQPALSAALARLRVYFADDLLVPLGRTMVPTPLAEELQPLARQLMEDATVFIGTSNVFDPTTSRRRFRIGTSDYITTVLLSPALRAMQSCAPHIQIDVYPTGPGIQDKLDRGEVDLVIGPEIYLPTGASAELLFEERHVVIGWNGNPALNQPLTLEAFLDLGQVAVRIGMDRALSFAEDHMRRFADQRRIEVTTTQFTSAPMMLIGTSRVSVLQSRLARTFVEQLPLAMQELPFEMPALKEFVQFNRTRQGDTGIRWLMDLLRRLSSAG
ncbi:LysR family transcriptional regulator [Sphingomonas glaciei]|uniref:LysR family transcriptional regulator n=1 Tax=Sphingomonas glaciei TaxID=2938948 RepID=A0ABY5MY38_9SPHN|nr:LysR family transcriptional regulator [Sphingomonas glaciei]UUR09369.1 LysR family transcriptional regulator [Sphingomonas glaciei]